MRHVISYLLFVGIPLAGLLGVLQVGRGIQAPRAVHGSWAVAPIAAGGRACTGYLLAEADSTLTIFQSGRQLTAALGPRGDVVLQGALTGDRLTLVGVIQPGATPRHVGCAAGDTLRLGARVATGGEIRRLHARLWSSACPGCAAVGFTASRSIQYHGRRRA